MHRLVFLAVAAATPGVLAAQSAGSAAVTTEATVEPFDKAIALEAVGVLATKLEQNFVFPAVGKAYAAMLRENLALGKYSEFADVQAFADAVTRDLQAVQKDGHLKVHIVPPEERLGPGNENDAAASEPAGPPQSMNTISRSGWIADGVAYIRFESFFGTDETMDALRAFIAEHRGARSLVIDIRTHRGGGLDEMDLLFPHLFSKTTGLLAMDTRASVIENGGGLPPQETLRLVAAPEGIVRHEHVVTPANDGAFQNTKVYVLTAKRTASAAEHLALALKRAGRATLIGETTRGAGNFGGMEPLDASFTYAAFIPFGRTFDPDTGQGWDGIGIEPNIAVPADQALDEALRLAGVGLSGEAALAAMK
ncbi:S41 family peptidase [Erythrobacter mangrovi]|uniref:S41 family peptidase n=1 Tax=Erythrobacter mangrovi TaxID=2739433 RepID=A0A7D3XHA5_9SPHN|nr:S41 family peptidase [Erythrobacter mangrovi]QKG71193.1 S41 family peptidase [Erythrobacter mangrovi]